jgi:hypothetical protein
MKEGVEFIRAEGLEPIVNGGDGAHSHVLEQQKGVIRLSPSISQSKVIIAFYILTVVCASAGAYNLFHGDIFDGVIFIAFAWCFYLFIKNGKGFGTILLDATSRELIKRRKGELITVGFDDIQHLEIINKIKSGGNGYFIKTSELNLSLKSGQRMNLATGGNMDIIIGQATALAEAIGCDVHHDDND